MNSRLPLSPKSKLITFALLAQAPFATLSADNVLDSLKDGKVSLNLRYRYEIVDQDSNPNKANASTIRTALGYESKSFANTTATIEFENVSPIGKVKYNTPGGTTDTSKPTVLDPDGTEINKLFLKYTGLKNNTFKLGRQKIVFDNARHIGNVGWRQNEQVFEALTWKNTAFNIKFDYAYVWQTNRIVRTKEKMNTHLLHATYPFKYLSATAYGYMLDFENDAGWNDTRDSNTFGLRLTGKKPVNNFTKLLYTFEYANQGDSGDNPLDYSADYMFLEAGASFGPTTFKIGYESLGSDGGKASFMTPLATVHAFNGWSDANLPLGTGSFGGNGLIDTMFTIATKFPSIPGLKAALIYHDLETDETSTDVGSEINAVVTYKSKHKLTYGLKYAAFDSDTPNSDINKTWIWTQFKF